MSDKALTVQTGLDLRSLGEVLARSGFFQDTKDAAQAIVKVLAGQEIGFGPVASMTGIYIVKGKVSLSANLMGAAVKRSGRYNYRVLELTDEAAEIEFYEDGKAIGRSRFTLDDAKKAGLNTSDNWRKYPRNMLFARALSNGVKWYCPDVTGGPAYTPDELGAMVDEDGDVVESEIVERPAAPVYQPKGDQSRRIQTGPVQALPTPPGNRHEPAPTANTANDGYEAQASDGDYPAQCGDALTSKTWERLNAYLTNGQIATDSYHATGKLRKALHAAGLIEAEDASWPAIYNCGATVGQAYALIMERQAAMAAADAEAAETEAAKPARKTAEQVAAIAGGAS